MKSKSIITASILGALLAYSPAVLAQSSQEKAQAYFFAAEAAFESGDYLKALDSVRKAEATSGQTGPVLLKLETKSLFELGRYEEAKSTLSQFYSSNPSEKSKREMSTVLLEIDKVEQTQREEEDRKNREFLAILPNKVGNSFRSRVRLELNKVASGCLRSVDIGYIKSQTRGQWRNGNPFTETMVFENVRADKQQLITTNGIDYTLKVTLKMDGVKSFREDKKGRRPSETELGSTRITRDPNFKVTLNNNAASVGAWSNLKSPIENYYLEILGNKHFEKIQSEVNREIGSIPNCFHDVKMNEYEKKAYEKNPQLFQDGFDGIIEK